MVIYWCNVLMPFYSLTLSHTLYLMPIRNAYRFAAIGLNMRLCWQFVCASLKHYSMCGHVVFTLRVTKTDKCNSSEQTLLLAPAWHEALQQSHVTRHTPTSVIRLATIQFRADQCLQHMQSPPGRVKGERISQSGGGRYCRPPSQTAPWKTAAVQGTSPSQKTPSQAL